MADRLSKIAAPVGANTKKTRVGRGVGSGLGKTAGRGQKGQKARATGGIGKLWFEGGQTPLMRRLPKRGFRNPFAAAVAEVNVGQLEGFDAGSTVDVEVLRERGLVKGQPERLKVLGVGDLSKKLTVRAHGFSKSAREKIEKAGGSVITIEMPKKTEEAEAPKAAGKAKRTAK